MQQGDYISYYHPNPNPNPNPTVDLQPRSYASAPPFSTSYSPSDYLGYSQNYPPYNQNPDPVPHTTPTYTPATPTATPSPPNPNSLFSFNPTPPQQPLQFPPYDSHGLYQPPPQQPPVYQHHYAPPNPNPNLPYSSAPFSHVGSSVTPVYDNLYENPNSVEFNSGGGYFDDKYPNCNGSRSNLGSDIYGKGSESVNFPRYDDGYGEDVYAYEGGKLEPYGARDTVPRSSNSTLFDDYGRSISCPSGKESRLSGGSGSSKIVRAVPKAETQHDAKIGVQKFRVKLLAESGGQNTMDVLCQIGLDGIRMLDLNTSRTLRIYPLENITRCELADSSTLAFWSKSSVDIEPRRIRLQSNSYTATTLLDIVTAATVQLKEMGGGRNRSSDSLKTAEQPGEKKKGFGDWMNLMKPGNEEKDHWVPDEAVSKCTACGTDFSAFIRKHHCRNCGDIFCDKCTHGRIALTADENAQPVRVCDRCMHVGPVS